jgi:crossover junction endodeoxyribonuclease RuvC
MRIIAIDPGYERLGIAVLEKNKKEELVFSTCFKTSKTLPFVERLELVGREVARVITEFEPTELAIENLFINSNQKTAMRVAEVRGAILYQARLSKLAVAEYTPLQVKVATTGYGKATKDQVVSMVQKLVARTEKKFQDDEMDAIAVGLTHFAHARHQNNTKRLSTASRYKV